jgi:hypothetical protein
MHVGYRLEIPKERDVDGWNVKMDREIEWGDLDWIDLVQDRDQ